MCEGDFPLSSCEPGGSLLLSFGQTKTREEQIKTRQEDGTKHSLFLSFFSHLAARGFHLLCVVCTPLDDNMTASLLLLHQHVNRQQRCGMSFVCLWGPNDTLTVVCMCFPLARLILISVTFSLFPVNTWVDQPFFSLFTHIEGLNAYLSCCIL